MTPQIVAIASAVGALLFVAPAYAAGDSDTSTPTCKQGQVYSEEKKACVDAEAGRVDDESLTRYAGRLAQDGRYREALAILDTLRNPNTAEALNYRGYATRKLGRVEEGIRYYLQSVALDPDYTLVREYLGEAYVTQGRLDLAKEQLGEIEARCGTSCEPYTDLAEAIAAAEA
jgi:tetratricopeptide (TPR) repeat protein